MMKRLLMPLVLMFSATGFAEQSKKTPPEQTTAPIIISYAEFSHLTRAEQRTYIKKLREMMVKIAERDPKAAALFFEKYPMLRQFMALTLPEAEAQTSKGAGTSPAKKSEPRKLKDDEIWKKTKQYLKESELYRNEIVQMTSKDLTAEERINLQQRYQISLSWIGMAGSAANAMGDEVNKAVLLKEVEQAMAQTNGLKAPVLQKFPESERASVDAGFNHALTTFTEPAFKNKISFYGAANQYALSAVPLSKQVEFEKKRPKVGLAEGATAAPANVPPPPVVGAAPPPPVAGAAQAPPPPATLDGKKPNQPGKNEGLPGQSSSGKIKYTPAGIDGNGGKGSNAGLNEGDSKGKGTAGKSGGQGPAGKDTKTGLAEGKDSDKEKSNAGGKEGDDSKPGAGQQTDKDKDKNKVKDQDKPSDVAASEGPFRCMHSGFVIQGKRCMAPSSLPFDMSPLDKEAFKCERGKVMCNPLIFGFNSKGCNWVKSSEEKKLDDCWRNAKPLCTFPGSLATVVCDEMSNTNDHIETAIDLIHANPEAWAKYRADFNSLCDAGNIDFASSRASEAAVRRDIKETCDIARKERDKILKRFGSKYWDELGPEAQKQLEKAGVRPRKQPAAPTAPAAPASTNGGVR